MNNESGALVNLPLPLPQPLSAALEEGPQGSQPAGPRLHPYPDAASLFLFAGPGSGSERKDSEGKWGGFRLGSGVRAGSAGPEVGSPRAALGCCRAPARPAFCSASSICSQPGFWRGRGFLSRPRPGICLLVPGRQGGPELVPFSPEAQWELLRSGRGGALATSHHPGSALWGGLSLPFIFLKPQRYPAISSVCPRPPCAPPGAPLSPAVGAELSCQMSG